MRFNEFTPTSRKDAIHFVEWKGKRLGYYSGVAQSRSFFFDQFARIVKYFFFDHLQKKLGVMVWAIENTGSQFLELVFFLENGRRFRVAELLEVLPEE